MTIRNFSFHRDEFFSVIYLISAIFSQKVVRSGQKWIFWKGEQMFSSFFQWFSVVLFSIENHPCFLICLTYVFTFWGRHICFHPVCPSITKVCEHNSFYILIGNSSKLCMVAYCRIEIHILLLLISLRFYFRRNCLLCISSQILSQALIKVFWKFKIWPHSAFWCIFCHGRILSDQAQVRFHI